MKTIQFPVKSMDFIDELVKREGNKVITERKNIKSLKTVCFDVQIIRTHKKTRTFHHLTTHAGDEYLPSASQWGQYGWSYPNLELAQKKFDEIEL
jgi:hypothetical protein